jgi:hypothetical protein
MSQLADSASNERQIVDRYPQFKIRALQGFLLPLGKQGPTRRASLEISMEIHSGIGRNGENF